MRFGIANGDDPEQAVLGETAHPRDAAPQVRIATDVGDGKTKVATTFTSSQGTSSPTVIVKDGHAALVSDGRYEFKILVKPQRS